jgi:hypothetical protein
MRFRLFYNSHYTSDTTFSVDTIVKSIRTSRKNCAFGTSASISRYLELTQITDISRVITKIVCLTQHEGSTPSKNVNG